MAKIDRYLYPEWALGGFVRNDQKIIFFNRVNALLRPDMTVLDFGAGRGKWADRGHDYLANYTSLGGKCAKLIGADVDPAVLENPLIDEAIVLGSDGRIPLADASVDMVVSWATFEHVTNPRETVAELTRILKPGGYICAWTPNKWAYFAIIARLVPNRLHSRVLQVMGGWRGERDVFPTAYKMNTLGALRRLFSNNEFDHHSYIHNGPPAYSWGRVSLTYLWLAWMWLLPSYFGQQIHCFMRKKGGHSLPGDRS